MIVGVRRKGSLESVATPIHLLEKVARDTWNAFRHHLDPNGADACVIAAPELVTVVNINGKT